MLLYTSNIHKAFVSTFGEMTTPVPQYLETVLSKLRIACLFGRFATGALNSAFTSMEIECLSKVPLVKKQEGGGALCLNHKGSWCLSVEALTRAAFHDQARPLYLNDADRERRSLCKKLVIVSQCYINPKTLKLCKTEDPVRAFYLKVGRALNDVMDRPSEEDSFALLVKQDVKNPNDYMRKMMVHHPALCRLPDARVRAGLFEHLFAEMFAANDQKHVVNAYAGGAERMAQFIDNMKGFSAYPALKR